MCVVEVKGARDLKVSCATECTDGMEVITMNERIYAWRRFIVEITADHDIDCFAVPIRASANCTNMPWTMGSASPGSRWNRGLGEGRNQPLFRLRSPQVHSLPQMRQGLQ